MKLILILAFLFSAKAWSEDCAFLGATETPKPKALAEAFKRVVARVKEVPADRSELLPALASELEVSVEDLNQGFSAEGGYTDINDLVSRVLDDNPKLAAGVVDRKIYSKEREVKLRTALRKADNFILFKLAENQDLRDFPSIEKLAEELNAPIIVAPAFSDVGLVPERLGWIFNHPRVHVFIGESIQYTKGLHIINNGTFDKIENPLVGLERIFEPTDRVIVFHPKIRTVPRATGNYDMTTSYLMTTGSMSDPIFSSTFNVGMPTDFRATREGEKNLGVLVVSRGYRDAKLDFVGGSYGVVPRRALYTEALYGNPAGLFDLGKIYSAEGAKQVPVIPAIVLGDLHLGATDPNALKAFSELLVSLGILDTHKSTAQLTTGTIGLGALVLHDLIDGTPNNHHTFEKLITRATLDKKGMLDLETHIQEAAAFLNRLLQILPHTQIVIPVDNHGSDWLTAVLQKGEFFKTHRQSDWPILIRLMSEAIQQEINPYERIFQYFGVNTDRVRFLRAKDNFRIGIDLQNPSSTKILQGVEVSQHSQYGVNGSRGLSVRGLLAAYGAAVVGHDHSTAEDGVAKRVGTFTHARQSFHNGPSRSDQSLSIIYSPTAVQLLRMNNSTFLPNAKGRSPEEQFPSEEFPILNDRPAPRGAATDQYRSNPPVSRRPR